MLRRGVTPSSPQDSRLAWTHRDDEDASPLDRCPPINRWQSASRGPESPRGRDTLQDIAGRHGMAKRPLQTRPHRSRDDAGHTTVAYAQSGCRERPVKPVGPAAGMTYASDFITLFAAVIVRPLRLGGAGEAGGSGLHGYYTPGVGCRTRGRAGHRCCDLTAVGAPSSTIRGAGGASVGGGHVIARAGWRPAR